MKRNESFGLCTRCDMPTDDCECPPDQSGCRPDMIGPALVVCIAILVGALIVAVASRWPEISPTAAGLIESPHPPAAVILEARRK